MKRFQVYPDLSQLSPDQREQIQSDSRRSMERKRWPRWAGPVSLAGALVTTNAVIHALNLNAWYEKLIAALLSAVPFGLGMGWVSVAAFVPHVREELRRRGLCDHCGYDLRATPERCPECGAPRAG